jgi:hypothetical protein
VPDIHYNWEADTTETYLVNRRAIFRGLTYEPGDAVPAYVDGARLKLLLQSGVIVRAADYGLNSWQQGK